MEIAKASHSGRTKRWREQRWVIDNIIQANGIDWDQPRSIYLALPGGAEASSDMIAVRARVRKYADAAPAFEAQARRREARAVEFEREGELVSARENYFIAAGHWGAAQWPIDDTNEQNINFNRRKRECYRNYARLADHRVEEVWLPLGEKKLPGWLHMPYGYSGGRVPVVINIPGMDSFKEMGVSMYGDRWLNRGIAVLALDGPGQYESALLGVYFSVEAWSKTGTAAVDWLSARPEIDATKIAISGTSFGSFFSTIAAAHEPRLAAVAVNATNLEPGAHTIFEEASPTFKTRFMWMSNFDDEAAFDEFRKTITWQGHVENIKSPYLAIAGEADELSPLSYTDMMFKTMSGPRQLLVYQDSRHSVGGVPSVTLGPNPGTFVANWIAARLAGKPIASERWYIDATGRVTKTPL
jgi:dienelactone hydrolase